MPHMPHKPRGCANSIPHVIPHGAPACRTRVRARARLSQPFSLKNKGKVA
jgi:hypothetical protein